MIPKIILVTTVVISSGGCSSFRQPPGTRSMIAFEKPSAGCVESYRDADISRPYRGYTCAEGQTVKVTNNTAVTPCDDTLWVHVYHPKRLKVRQACISVTGVTVDATRGREKDGCRHEADGDGHCWLKLDAGQEGLLIPGNNASKQGGNMVFEPICRYGTTQADAIPACDHWPGQKEPLPPIGSHVRITGPYVFDSQHGHVEIHPPTLIEVLR